jgi:anti-sigma regulatory factor (Ser/Thr protein kinase)
MNVQTTLHRNNRSGHNDRTMTYALDLASPPAECSALSTCPLSPRPDAARRARAFTRQTLGSWGLAELSDDAEVIVSELLANAVRHAAADQGDEASPASSQLGLWLLRHPQGLMCAVIDPSDRLPEIKQPGCVSEGGRGLHVIHSLSDHWGWTPLSERGKAVWAILFRD